MILTEKLSVPEWKNWNNFSVWLIPENNPELNTFQKYISEKYGGISSFEPHITIFGESKPSDWQVNRLIALHFQAARNIARGDPALAEQIARIDLSPSQIPNANRKMVTKDVEEVAQFFRPITLTINSIGFSENFFKRIFFTFYPHPELLSLYHYVHSSLNLTNPDFGISPDSPFHMSLNYGPEFTLVQQDEILRNYQQVYQPLIGDHICLSHLQVVGPSLKCGWIDVPGWRTIGKFELNKSAK